MPFGLAPSLSGLTVASVAPLMQIVQVHVINELMANKPLTGFKICEGHPATERCSHLTPSEMPVESLKNSRNCSLLYW